MVAKNQVVKVFNIKTLKDLPDVGYQIALDRLCGELYMKLQRVEILQNRIEEIKTLLRDYNKTFNNDQRTQEHKIVFGKHGYYIDKDKERKTIAEELVKKVIDDITQVQTLKLDTDKVKAYCKLNNIDLNDVQTVAISKGCVKAV